MDDVQETMLVSSGSDHSLAATGVWVDGTAACSIIRVDDCPPLALIFLLACLLRRVVRASYRQRQKEWSPSDEGLTTTAARQGEKAAAACYEQAGKASTGDGARDGGWDYNEVQQSRTVRGLPKTR